MPVFNRDVSDVLFDETIAQELAALDAKDQRRALRTLPHSGGVIEHDGRPLVNFSSNDYLNLANDPRVIQGAQAAVAEYGCGATASRLMAGNLPIHDALEQRLAALTRHEACLVFPSGFQTNVATISALMSEGGTIFSDELNHASIIDGARLAKAHVYVYRHNDTQHLEQLLAQQRLTGRRVIVSDSVFSMDGDLADVAGLARLAREYDAALLIDEAHAIGVFGNGAGLCPQLGVTPDITTGTLSKSLGSAGGFAACSAELRDYFVNKSRPFIFSTGLSPAVAGAALAALDVIESEPNLGTGLLKRAAAFYGKLRHAGLDVPETNSQVIPLMAGENTRALQLFDDLLTQAIFAIAIRPPSVPEGTARLRLSVTLAHTPETLEASAATIIERCAALAEAGV